MVMKKHIVVKSIVLFFLCMQALPAWPQESYVPSPGEPNLTVKNIINLFSHKLNEAINHYKLRNIRFDQGEFTRVGSFEAIVSFDDEDQPHATGYYEVWLLSYRNGWRLTKKLFDWDVGKFMIVNINDHGRPKIWIEGSGGNQGYFQIKGKLISLENGRENILFSTKGYNNSGAFGKFDMFEIDFKVIDKNQPVEIVETRVKGKYDRKKDKNIITSKKKYNYKFNGKKYERVKDQT
jgi:hypothetical protein